MKTTSAAYKRQQQLEEAAEHAEADVSHSVGYGRAHAERGDVHHDVGELEHHLASGSRRRPAWAGASASLIMASATAKMRLKTTTCSTAPSATDLAMFSGKMCRMVSCALSLLTGTVSRSGRGGQLDADSGLAEVDRRQSEEDRDGGDDLEEDDGAKSQPADLLQVGVPGDAHHQRPEDQRRDDGLDQPQEDERQHSQVGRNVGKVVTDLGAQQHGDEDPCGERAAEAAIHDESGQCDPAQTAERGVMSGEAPAQQCSQRDYTRDQQRDVLPAIESRLRSLGYTAS